MAGSSNIGSHTNFEKKEGEQRHREEDASVDLRAKCWWYRDPQGIVQGPFSTNEMRHWQSMGYFQPALPIRYTETGTFYPLRVLFPGPAVPFSALPSSLAKNSSAQPSQAMQAARTPAPAPQVLPDEQVVCAAFLASGIIGRVQEIDTSDDTVQLSGINWSDAVWFPAAALTPASTAAEETFLRQERKRRESVDKWRSNSSPLSFSSSSLLG